jgi:2'-5' RNA ligase
MALYQQLSASLAASGFEPLQREFGPHITLGKAPAIPSAKIDLEIDVCLSARQIVLFQSQLTASGPLPSGNDKSALDNIPKRFIQFGKTE